MKSPDFVLARRIHILNPKTLIEPNPKTYADTLGVPTKIKKSSCQRLSHVISSLGPTP